MQNWTQNDHGTSMWLRPWAKDATKTCDVCVQMDGVAIGDGGGEVGEGMKTKTFKHTGIDADSSSLFVRQLHFHEMWTPPRSCQTGTTATPVSPTKRELRWQAQENMSIALSTSLGPAEALLELGLLPEAFAATTEPMVACTLLLVSPRIFSVSTSRNSTSLAARRK
eukprot:15459699-Alexandrium_andersonii.AAC.1